MIGLTVLIGYRYQVGGDWGTYLAHYDRAVGQSFVQALSATDPSYGALNWLSAKLGWGIYGVNLACGALFGAGLVIFCRQQPLPWLALAVAVPYLVIVVAMGYSRQSVAVGVAMLGLAALANRRVLAFCAWIALAATFHKSAVILIPLAALSARQNRVWIAFWVTAAGVVLYYLLVSESVDRLFAGYVTAEYESEGAQIRIAMNAIPAILLLALRNRLPMRVGEKSLWTWMSVFALCLIPALSLSPSSTAVDRVALYMIPLQLFVYSRLPLALASLLGPASVTWAVVAYSAIVQYVWLSFASHAFLWLPYRFYPWALLHGNIIP